MTPSIITQLEKINGITLSPEHRATILECLGLDAAENETRELALVDNMSRHMVAAGGADFRAKTQEERLWDDGEEMGPIDWPDVFAGLTETERAELELEIDKSNRLELQRLDKQRRQAESPNWKHRWETEGGDIADFARDNAVSAGDMEHIAKECGFRQATWNDQKNVTRRAKVAKNRREDFQKTNQLKDATKAQPVPTESPRECAKCKMINFIEAGKAICSHCETPKAKPMTKTTPKTFEEQAREILESAAKVGTIGTRKVDSMLAHYMELHASGKEANTLIDLLNRSLAAKAARK